MNLINWNIELYAKIESETALKNEIKMKLKYYIFNEIKMISKKQNKTF